MHSHQAVIAQLGERQTEDLKVPGSIPGRGIFFPNLIHLHVKVHSFLDQLTQFDGHYAIKLSQLKILHNTDLKMNGL